MKTIVPILATGAMLILFACAKKPEPVEVGPPPVKSVKPSASASQEDPLEAERSRLEALMNKIMDDDIYFEYDQAILTSQAKDLLTEVGDILKRESRFSILTEGHTDERGTETYNMGLGMRRADAVVKFLVDYGVKNHMEKVSFGEEKPKATGNTEEDFAKNRRAAFKVKINN
jgi:peptidoglycan-associated lipoprotein